MITRSRNRRYASERGQTMIVVILVIGIVLLGFIALAVDYSNMWFKRQTAQGAADAACQAAAMNMLVAATGTPTSTQGFVIGTPFDCSSAPTASPCQYAALNGYTANGLTAGTESKEVHVSFPPAGSVPGVTTASATLAPVPLVQVDVVDRARVYFAPLFTGSKTQDVRAGAICGLVEAAAPIPLIVLNPSCQHAFEVSGSSTIKIVGGPTRSVQVNSINTACASATNNSASGCGGSGTIDLSQGGPSFSGSNFGSFGGPTTPPTNFLPGATGSWSSPSSPIPDPFANTPAPGVPPAAPAPVSVAYHHWGCPDDKGCKMYSPGLYTTPIVVKGETAIFKAGVYYLRPSTPDNVNCGDPGSGCIAKPTGQCHSAFTVDSNGVVRPASDGDASTNLTAGAMFYLSGADSTSYGSAFFGSNAGKAPGGHTLDKFPTASMSCPGGPTPSGTLGIPANVDGNVLLAECTAGGTYIDHSGAGVNRGLLFFQDRANADSHAQMSMQGGGGLLLSGTLYVHNCTASPCREATGVNPNYQAFLQLQGSPGSGTYLFGEIVADEFVIGGTGTVAMQLSPFAILHILKVQLLR